MITWSLYWRTLTFVLVRAASDTLQSWAMADRVTQLQEAVNQVYVHLLLIRITYCIASWASTIVTVLGFFKQPQNRIVVRKRDRTSCAFSFNYRIFF